jgi:pilus assembly protein Flp/PilA
MKKLIKRFLREEDGVTAIEYGLIAGLIAIVIILSLNALGTSLNGFYTRVAGELDTAAG